MRPMAARPHRNLAIAGGVVLFHVAALWGLQSGLVRRAAEVVVPVEILARLIEVPQPRVEPPTPTPPSPAPAPPAPRPVERKIQRPPPAPRPVAVPDPLPAPAAPTAVAVPQPPAPPVAAPVAAPEPAPAPPAPAPAPATVELPSSSADYLQNPKPPYPPASKRLGEQGKVVVRVLIGTDGTAQKAELRQSSGFDRLDQTALSTVLKWRYVPGKRGGVPEAMWFEVPINFVLE
ncbi:energy transducer TonB [Ramlibacter tataouinensis]